MTGLARTAWMRALTAHPPEHLKAVAKELSAGCTVRLTRLPQAGLGLLALRDGAFHEPYYLGEFPLSSCSVEVEWEDGRKAAGGAQVLADDAELAQALAILDALLAARLPGWERIASLVEAGALQRAEEARRRQAILAATRVDFEMLNDSRVDDEDS